MRKNELVVFAFVIVFLFSGGVLAISSDMKDIYAPKETMIIKLSGSILSPILPDQIQFKRANVNIPLEHLI